MRTLSLVDDLTGLYNRRGFLTLAEQELKLASRLKRGMFLLFVDLDHLKGINDRYGHQEGDRALIAVANITKETYRDPDIIARIGGDEFVFVLSNVESAEHAKVVAQKILDAMAQSLHVDGCEIMLSGSVGIAMFPFDGDATERLIRNADSAMYKAKECGKNNYRFFSEPLLAG